MNQTITITSESIAEQLDQFQVRNYDPHALEHSIAFTYPALHVGISRPSENDSHLTMLASEAVLAREWNTEEEDKAWSHL